MQIAWTYLLHAQFERDKTDYWYRDANTNRRTRRLQAFELARCIKQVFPNHEHPVRRNVEFFIGFRNKIEHRYETLLESVVAGKCQSLIMNYERLLVDMRLSSFSVWPSAFGTRNPRPLRFAVSIATS